MKPLLAVENVSKSFGGLQALTDVNFSVEVGERLVIIGPNGAGKTTLFNLILGELRPTSGRIYFAGEDVTHMPSHHRAHLGMSRTFQITNLFLNLTLHENILLAVEGMSPLRFTMHRPVTSCKDILTKTQRLVAAWNLRESEHSLVGNLSYGVQRQVEVLMALASEARLLLLDEPTAGLSPAETSALVSIILNLDASITLLIIEHDMDVAFQLAHRLIVLNHGQVLAGGSPEKIKADPEVRHVYLGEELEYRNARG